MPYRLLDLNASSAALARSKMNSKTIPPPKESVSQRTRFSSILTVVISVAALVFSGISLFITQLQPARIEMFGSDSGFLYFETNDSLLRLNLHVVFINRGAGQGLVDRVGVILRPPGASEAYLLPAMFFEELDDVTNTLKAKSAFDPISLPGHTAATQWIQFTSSYKAPGDILDMLVPGEYRATIVAWTPGETRPGNKVPFTFKLTDSEMKYLEAKRNGQQGPAIKIQNLNFFDLSARKISAQDLDRLLR